VCMHARMKSRNITNNICVEGGCVDARLDFFRVPLLDTAGHNTVSFCNFNILVGCNPFIFMIYFDEYT
jgi:hypothetical protein